MEYSEKSFTQEELKLLVKEFDNLIERLIVPVKPEKRKVLGLFHKKQKEEKEFLELETKLESLEKAAKQKAIHTPEERLKILMEKIKVLIKQNKLADAKEGYKELISEFELSPKEIQKLLYKETNELFKQLNATQKVPK
jgi:hypothetical protein